MTLVIAAGPRPGADRLREFDDWLLRIPLAPSTIYNYGHRIRAVYEICERRGWDPLDLSVNETRLVAACP